MMTAFRYIPNAVAIVYMCLVLNGSEGFVSRSRSVPYHQHSSLLCGQKKDSLATKLEISEAPTKDTEALDSTASSEGMEENPRKEGLALLLDDGTRKSHNVAQNTAFVCGFFKGIGTKSSFATLVTSLYFVYDAMEKAFDYTSDECVKSLDSAEIRRVSSLEKDMEYFYGSAWKDMISPSKATKEYVARVEEVASTEPYLLVAHQYTRYLGDLFGGKMMGGMATRSLGLEDGRGTSFYTFDEIRSTDKFITDWYRKLNDLNLTDEQKTAIVEEANLVFDLNIGILEELEGSPIQAVIILAINSLKSKLGFRS